MLCYVQGCDGFAKRCLRVPYKNSANGAVVHTCADHWPKAVS